VRRVAFYLFHDPQGQVDDYVLHTLAHLRPHVEHLFVVSNAVLDGDGRNRLETVADRVWERENIGFDVWAYKEAMTLVGPEQLAEHDELLLLNSTFFGPIGSFAPLFDQMDGRSELDFWGITEHGNADEHAFDDSRTMAAHVQSHWIAVRRRMFTSEAWDEYWRDMPMIDSYQDSVVRHESRFTPWFVERGFTSAVAFPAAGYHSAHPIMDDVAQMVRDGCPIVKRRTFFHDPLYNESHATDGRQLVRLLAERGYPVDHLFANLARTAKPRSLVTNLGLIEVLPDVSTRSPATSLRVVCVAHVHYPEMTDQIVDRLDTLPSAYDLVVTTADENRRAAIRRTLAQRGRDAEVRVVGSNRGRDISAFYVDCRDVIESDDHDLVVKVHSKRSPQDPPATADLFRRHLFENLLGSAGYTANVLALFDEQPTLGMVFPPVYHIGYPTLGHAWFGNKDAALRLVDRLGITVPFDDTTPLAPYGSMFIARPQALRAMTAAGFTHQDFPGDDDYRDGALTHVLERLAAYVVLSSGHHVREVMSADLAAVNYSYLEYRLTTLASRLPGYPRQQLNRIAKLKRFRRRFGELDGPLAELLGVDASPTGPQRAAPSRWLRRLPGREGEGDRTPDRPGGSGGAAWRDLP
jgi:lipopolysaccharide biosynthesis protein